MLIYPQPQNFSLVAGNTRLVKVTIVDTTNAPVNLTGATIVWGMATDPNQTPILEKSTTSGQITVPNPTTGVFQFNLTVSDTENRTGSWYHETRITDSLGNVSTAAQGSLTILPALIRENV